MVRAFAEEVVRAMRVAQHHDGAVFRLVMPHEKIEFRLLLPFLHRNTFQKAVEKLAYGLGSPAAEREHAPHEMFVMVDHRLLHASQVFEITVDVVMDILEPLLPDTVQQHVHLLFQGQDTMRTCLEMKVFRSRRPALGAVVEHRETRQRPRHIQHVHEMMPDGLRQMTLRSDHQMLQEYGERIDLNAVFPALAALEGHGHLLPRKVLPAKEAGRILERVGVRSGHGRRQPGGIVLQHDFETSDLKAPGRSGFQSAETGRDLRPDRKLVLYEFPNLLHGSKKGFERLADHLELLLEIGGENIVGDMRVNVRERPEPPFRDFYMVRMKVETADCGEDIDQLAFHLRLEDVRGQGHGIEIVEAELLPRFAEKGF